MSKVSVSKCHKYKIKSSVLTNTIKKNSLKKIIYTNTIRYLLYLLTSIDTLYITILYLSSGGYPTPHNLLTIRWSRKVSGRDP